MKRCSTCKIKKSFDLFHADKRSKDGKSYSCIECATQRASSWYAINKNNLNKAHAWAKHLTKYWPNATPAEALNNYEFLARQQNLLCKICERPEIFKDPRTKKTRKLSVDHCHITGAVRGLLCNRCNKCVGQLEDSVLLLTKMISYLTQAKGENA